MVRPVTKVEVLLSQIVELLTEIRDQGQRASAPEKRDTVETGPRTQSAKKAAAKKSR